MAKSPLRVLVDILSDAVAHIESEYAAANLSFPTLDDVFDPNSPTDILYGKKSILEQSKVVVAAAEQLSVMVTEPSNVLLMTSMAHHRSACMRVALDANVPEILREAGPRGLHVKNIASKSKMSPKKLARVLRLLATFHIFKELKPDVFANNRLSGVLDSGKPVSSLTYPPKGEKYVGTNGVAALALHACDEVMKSSAYTSEHLLSPETAHTEEPNQTQLNRVFNMNVPQFDWMAWPENVDRAQRIHAGMSAVRFAEEIVTPTAFPWETLPSGATIVDVGGGIGRVAMEISEKFPDYKYVIQDFSILLDQAKKYWNDRLPGRFEAGKVVFQIHDFFQEQPVKNADVFIHRAIIHDWSDPYVIKILKRLRDAAVPGKTKLLLMESVINYACRGLPCGLEDIVNIDKVTPYAPEPLLANLGRGCGWLSHMDLIMLTNLNGQERMMEGHVHVCKEAGWKVTHLYSPTSPVFRQVLAVPI